MKENSAFSTEGFLPSFFFFRLLLDPEPEESSRYCMYGVLSNTLLDCLCNVICCPEKGKITLPLVLSIVRYLC